MVEIIIQFPNQSDVDEFAGQMSDGVGESICDFSHHRQKPGTDGTKPSDFEKVYDKQGRRVYFITEMFED